MLLKSILSKFLIIAEVGACGIGAREGAVAESVAVVGNS
jgi:hypothetical protein